MGLDNFKDGVKQPRRIDNDTVGIKIPVEVYFTEATVEDSGEIDMLIDLCSDEINQLIADYSSAESWKVIRGEAKEVPLSDATWD